MTNPKPVVPLTPEQRQMVEENIGLAYFMTNILRPHSFMEYDDLLAVCMEGLCHAAQIYDPDRGYAFSTLVSKCVRNWHKKQHYRYIRRHENESYLEDLTTEEEGTTWADWLYAGKRPLDDMVISSMTIQQAFRNANLFEREKEVMGYVIANPDIVQREIAEATSGTPQSVGAAIRRAKAKIHKQLAG